MRWLTTTASLASGGPQHTRVIRDVCPRGQAPTFKTTGYMHHGHHHHHGPACRRQVVQCYEPYLIAEDPRRLLDRVGLARRALRGMWRVVGGTLPWLWGFLGQCFAAVPAHRPVPPGSCQPAGVLQRLAVAADALASVGPKQANKQWGERPGGPASPAPGLAWGCSQPQECRAPMGAAPARVPSARHVCHGSRGRVCAGEACGAPPSPQPGGAPNQAHRTG